VLEAVKYTVIAPAEPLAASWKRNAIARPATRGPALGTILRLPNRKRMLACRLAAARATCEAA
jgi:hypothetical protein